MPKPMNSSRNFRLVGTHTTKIGREVQLLTASPYSYVP